MNWRERLPWRTDNHERIESIGNDLERIARQASLAKEPDLDLEIALAIKRIEAQPHNVFVWPHRALPREAFEALLRSALLAVPPGDASALRSAIQPLLTLHESDYTTDLRFGQWIDVAEDGCVELGLHADIEGRPDLALRWTGSRWQPYWRDGSSWHVDEMQDQDLAALLTDGLDWNYFNAYVFDSLGVRKSFA